MVAKDAQTRVENNSRKPRGLLQTGQSDSPKKSQLITSQGMLKKRDDDNEFDDEVRTTVPSQN
jgi:hypothetical protein